MFKEKLTKEEQQQVIEKEVRSQLEYIGDDISKLRKESKELYEEVSDKFSCMKTSDELHKKEIDMDKQLIQAEFDGYRRAVETLSPPFRNTNSEDNC